LFELPPLLCVVGPTASGKTSLAIELARALDGEVISVDASQVYRGLDIGTGKARFEELEGVPHHLLDVVAPDGRFDVSRFIELAERSIWSLWARGKLPILCGGTGLYFKGLLYGLCEAPPVSAEVRARLAARIEAGELAQLHRELSEVDPSLAARLNPHDKQRIERALGVYLTTGQPLSELQAAHGFERLRAPVKMIGVDHERAALNERIARRVEQMWAGGFVEEVEALRARGYGEALQSMGAIGYRLAMQHLEGALSRAEAMEKMTHATRQYARRQRRYFDRQLPTEWWRPEALSAERPRLLEELKAWRSSAERPPEQVRRAMTPFETRLWGDKSVGHRAFIFASIAGSVERPALSAISGLGSGADLASTREAMRALGVSITEEEDGVWRVIGRGFEALKAPAHPIDCGNSGTTIRLLSGLLSGLDEELSLDGDASLRRRPMRRLSRALSPFGRGLEVGPQGGAPVTVGGPKLTGQSPQVVEVDTELSSAQVKSAALLAALSGGVERVEVRERALSRDHSERMLSALGHRVERSAQAPTLVTLWPAERTEGFELEVPGDPSSAAFWVAARALAPPELPAVLLRGVMLNSTRAGFFTIAQRMGIELELRPRGLRLGEPVGDLCIWGAPEGLKGVTVARQEALDALDELPLVALLGALAAGETVVRDAPELRVKESDRVSAMTELLNRIGGQVRGTEGGWEIQGVEAFTGGEVSSEGDHRVAICGRLARLRARGELRVIGAESAKVSYPEFEAELERYLALDDRAARHDEESDR